jgi:hypothetical protein
MTNTSFYRPKFRTIDLSLQSEFSLDNIFIFFKFRKDLEKKRYKSIGFKIYSLVN